MSVNKGQMRKWFKPAYDGETGEIDASKEPEFKGFIGNLECAGFSGKVWLKPTVKRSEKSPDFRLMLETEINGNKGFFDFGASWFRTAESGADYLSIKFDNEVVKEPVWLSGFPPVDGDDPDEGAWPIVWSRPKRNAGPKVSGPKPEQIDDEIPDFG